MLLPDDGSPTSTLFCFLVYGDFVPPLSLCALSLCAILPQAQNQWGQQIMQKNI